MLDCLLQVHIAQEDTKFGLDESEINEFMDRNRNEPMSNARIVGLMGMASFTENMSLVRDEFKKLKEIFDRLTAHDSRLTTLSLGMSSDYKIAIEEGSNMVRIGSLLFGERVKPDQK